MSGDPADQVAATLTALRIQIDAATDALFERHPEPSRDDAWDGDPWDDIRNACIEAEQNILDATVELDIPIYFNRYVGAYVTTKPKEHGDG